MIELSQLSHLLNALHITRMFYAAFFPCWYGFSFPRLLPNIQEVGTYIMMSFVSVSERPAYPHTIILRSTHIILQCVLISLS